MDNSTVEVGIRVGGDRRHETVVRRRAQGTCAGAAIAAVRRPVPA
jgi:hypothetical protein